MARLRQSNTHTHVLTHAQRHWHTQSRWRWVSEVCVLWDVAPYGSFQRLLSGLNQTLTLETPYDALSRTCGGQNVTFLSRQDTVVCGHSCGQRGKNTRGQNTNIWIFCVAAVNLCALLQRGSRPTLVPFWLAKGVFDLICSFSTDTSEKCSYLSAWLILGMGQEDGWIVSQYFFFKEK